MLWKRKADRGNAATNLYELDIATAGWAGNAVSSSTMDGRAEATGDGGNAVTSGWGGHSIAYGHGAIAAASGECGEAEAYGGRGIAAASWGNASTSGWASIAAVTGDGGAASAEGPDSVAVAWGAHGKAKGKLGAWLVLQERDGWGCIQRAEVIKVDGKRIIPNVWYMMKDGQILEADHGQE